jgi:hypothetical protein
MNGIAAGGGPVNIGLVRRRRRLEIRRRRRLNVVTLVSVVTFPSDSVARKANRHSDRSDKALDHGPMLLVENWAADDPR